MWEGHRGTIRFSNEISQKIKKKRLEIQKQKGLLSWLCKKGNFKKEEMKLDDDKMTGDEGLQDPPIVEHTCDRCGAPMFLHHSNGQYYCTKFCGVGRQADLHNLMDMSEGRINVRR